MKQLLRNKKGQALQQLGAAAIALVGVGITLVVGFLIFSQVLTQVGTTEGIDTTNATQCATSSACNATEAVIDATAILPSFLPIFVITIIGAILIGMVVMFRRIKTN